jgi:ferritin-like metal-binding protein YciE
MSKQIGRILDDVDNVFERHYTDTEERIEFLEELIEELEDRLEDLNCDDDECGICPEGECDCEPEVCI